MQCLVFCYPCSTHETRLLQAWEMSLHNLKLYFPNAMSSAESLSPLVLHCHHPPIVTNFLDSFMFLIAPRIPAREVFFFPLLCRALYVSENHNLVGTYFLGIALKFPLNASPSDSYLVPSPVHSTLL